MKKFVAMFIFAFFALFPSSTQAAKLSQIPQEALDHGSVVYDLGYARDTDGRLVQGIKIVHYKNFYNHKPNHDRGGNSGGDKTSSCYSYLANGAKWLDYEDYVVDPTNSVGLGHSDIRNIIASSINEWESHSQDVFGVEDTSAVADGLDDSSPDNKNEVMFGSISSPGAIAVTNVWGVFSGPPFARYLAEWDQLYDQADFTWNIDGNNNDMDFENIAQHEIGHALGMGHPSNTCVDETMYAYASEGETKKRDLNSGDIDGIFNLYK